MEMHDLNVQSSRIWPVIEIARHAFYFERDDKANLCVPDRVVVLLLRQSKTLAFKP